MVILCTSLFFIAWSLFVYFTSDQIPALYGVLSFTASTLTGCFLLSKIAPESGRCALINVVSSHFMNAAYFAISAAYAHHESLSTGWIIVSSTFAIVYAVTAILGYTFLAHVQRFYDLEAASIKKQNSSVTTNDSADEGEGTSMDNKFGESC